MQKPNFDNSRLINFFTTSTLYLLFSSCQGYHISCHSITLLVFKSSLFCLIMALNHKSNDTGNADIPKRSHKCFEWKGKHNTRRYFKEGEEDHIHITYYCILLQMLFLLLIILNLLLCLIYTLNFIIVMYAWKKKHSIYSVRYYPCFHPLGVLIALW